MAKKGQPAQLQIEVGNDDEWEKLLQKDGLIVVDVYSDWCGPCLGMQANLKKIKVEVGGDMLQLAIAKSDGITALKRFRNKSEPTWMFLSKGKMINLMFGADAPKLTRLILDELKKEQAQLEGQATDRNPIEVSEMAPEERTRYDAAESIEREIREKEERKKAKEVLERRTKECENIIANLPNFGTALIFPSAKDKYKKVLNEILDEAGLVIGQTEKVQFDEDILRELCFFANVADEFSESALEELLDQESVMVLFKIAPRVEIEDIDEAMLKMVYGEMKKPPGSGESVAHKLKVEQTEAEDEEEPPVVKASVGVWVPMTPQVRATALRLFFPKVSTEFTIPEPPPEPEHIAVIFPLNKKDEALQVMQQFPNEIMKHGIFTSANCADAKLVSKTFKKLDKLEPSQRTYSEKLVIQVSKQKSECILAFAQLEPMYMSPNAKEGKAECSKFFPDEEGDAVQEEEDEEEEEEAAIEEGAEEKPLMEGDEERGGGEEEVKEEEEGDEGLGEITEEGEAVEGAEGEEVSASELPPTESGLVADAPLPELPDPPTEEPGAA